MAYGFTNADANQDFGSMMKNFIEVVTSSMGKEASLPKIIIESSGHPQELRLLMNEYP